MKGLPWTGGAIGNARWAGARLYDVLRDAGMTEEMAQEKVRFSTLSFFSSYCIQFFFTKVRHVVFEAYDEGADGSPYGASIPVEKGFNPFGDVLLAYEMNGETLPR